MKNIYTFLIFVTLALVGCDRSERDQSLDEEAIAVDRKTSPGDPDLSANLSDCEKARSA